MDFSTLRKENAHRHEQIDDRLHLLDLKLTRIAVFATLGSLVLGALIGSVVQRLL